MSANCAHLCSSLPLIQGLMPGTFAKGGLKPLPSYFGIDLTIYNERAVWLREPGSYLLKIF